MACLIRDNKFYAPNGEESQLHKDLVGLVGETQAEDLFVLAYSDQFGYNKEGEPKAVDVIEFARQQNENTEPLTTAEKVELQIQFPNFETSDDILVELEKAFYKDGLFNPTKKSLTKRLYSQFEAENLLSDISLLKQVKDSLERLKRTETIQNAISLDEEFKSSELNMFGKFKMLNPYIVKQGIIEEFGGVENADISEIRDKTITEDFLKQFKRIPVIDQEGNPIVNKIVYEEAVKLVDDSTIFELETEEEVKTKLLDYGIKIENIDPITLKNFLENPTKENTDIINKESQQREEVIKIDSQERDLVYLETLKTEEQLFEEMNLIQTNIENVYHKIERVDEQELRDFLKVEDIVPEHQLYKEYYNYKTPIRTKEDFKASVIETDIEYLKGEFIADFNIEILKNPAHDFYNKFEINEKGISLKYSDPISIVQIKAYLEDGVKLGKELADYSVISKNIPNLKEENLEVYDRISAINNKNKLKKPTTQVTQIDSNSLLAKNETADFINYKNEVYEMKNKEANDTVYIKLNTLEDLNYYQTEVETKEYVDQVNLNQQKLEKYNDIKKLYKKADLGDNFDCI